MKIQIITIINFLYSFSVFVTSTDTLTTSNSLTINQTLISSARKFGFGFFSKGNPSKYFIGIWYKDIPSEDIIVWVGNRGSPLLTSSSFLKLGNDSSLSLFDGESQIVWQTNHSSSNPSSNSSFVLQLLDSGNLVIREAGDSNPSNYIWESFDNPTDTLIPGQKIGWDLKTGLNRFLSSWRREEDPSIGNFSLSLDYHGDPEIYMRNGDKIIYRSGPWVGQRFSGLPEMNSGNHSFNFTFYTSSDKVQYWLELPPNHTVKSRLVLTSDGYAQRWAWVPELNQWHELWYARKDECDYYRKCGEYTICNASALFVCECPLGFRPKNPYAWSLRDGSNGCVRETSLDCKSDGFLTLDNMKLPRTLTAVVDRSLSLDQCRDMCKGNCSCSAYADLEFFEGVGSGCVIWSDNLTDMRNYVDGGQTLYIRLAATDLLVVESSPAKGSSNSNSTKKVAMGVGITVAAAIILTGLIILIINSRKISRNVQRVARSGGIKGRSQENLFSGHTMSSMVDDSGEANNDDDHELLMFDFYSMGVATYNFSKANKLGQGGFGLVYKGVMLDGKEVAIKRLSKESGQGSEEFKNELRLIAKLQHRNLVRLLGCCVDKDEKMLIYEYLVNRSLDSLLFNKERSYLLNWQTRFNIICGIARGLLYLHQDSRYRIIHRDLKASNILLDAYMTPKISDFGMARIFGGDEIEGNTRRVVGTYGYMAPEYAMDGVFSIKSDVFSFGVLVLEILNGTKNRGFYRANNELNLLGYSWKQWREGKGTEMLDKAIGEEYSTDEVLRCLQVGLLCVQERPEDRPTMGNVVLMLSSETTSLPMPKLPGFCVERNPNETESSSSKRDESLTVNQVTITTLNAR